MFFVDSLEPYTSPDPNRVYYLREAKLKSTLTFEEIIDITISPYSNEKWCQLSYYVSKHSLQPYNNDSIGEIADRKIANGDWTIDQTSINCLYYETYLRFPSICNWTRHFLYFTKDNFFGSIGIYSIHLATNTSENTALRQFANVAQYQLISNSPFNRFMLAIQKGEKWKLAFGEILPIVTPRMYTKSRRIKISLFKEPSKFFYELLRGGNANNILHDEFEMRVRI